MTAKAIIAKEDSKLSSSSHWEGGDDFVLVKKSELVQGLGSVSRFLSGDHPESLDATVTPRQSGLRPASIELKQPANNQTSTSGLKKEEIPPEKKELKMLVRLSTKKGGMRYTTTLNYGGSLAANATVGKYLLQFPTSVTQFKVDLVSNAGEWTSFNSVFEEFFCSKMSFRYIPTNRYLASVGATNLCSSSVTVAGYQHDQAAVTDAASNYYQMMNSSQSKVFDSADPFSYEWKNIEKFSWDGTANNVVGSQGWMNIADVANYGGYVSASTPFAAAAGSTSSTWNQSQVLGVVLLEFRMHFRYRD